MKSHDLKLKSEILNKGLLRSSDMQKAEEEVDRHKSSLRESLLRLNLLREEVVLGIEADILGVSYLDLDKYLMINDKIIKMVPETVARSHHIIPVFKIGRLTIATCNPSDILALDEIRHAVGEDFDIVLSTREMIQHSIDQYYSGIKIEKSKAADKKAETSTYNKDNFFKIDKKDEAHFPASDAAKDAEEMPVIGLVNNIITRAVDEKASDIHIEPEENMVRVRNRVDGVMHEAMTFEKKMLAPIVSRIKIMSKLDIAETRKPQDGKIRLKMENQDLDLRVSTFPTTHGENIVLRILEQSKVILGMGELGLDIELIKRFEQLIVKPYGMILVTGPTGAGKTTTLYAALNKINSIEKNIITIEDPVEYQMTLIRQTQVNAKAGLTFATGLRNILRQDPDVILVGEIRDADTVSIAVEAALTGHLVFSTIHTNDAAGSITRLLDMQIEPFLISSSLIAVLAQRLIRTICEKCKEVYIVEPEIIKRMGVKTDQTKFFRGKGCHDCKKTGYSKRLGVYELLVIDEDIRRLILTRASNKEIKAMAIKKGMVSMRTDGLRKAEKGITTLEEVLKATLEEDES